MNSGNYSYREAANVVQPATMLIQGCQAMGQVGGSNTRAAGMLGIGFTPEECYSFMEAQGLLAVGDRHGACEVLHANRSAKRARQYGASMDLSECPPNQQAVVYVDRVVEVSRGPTEDEVQLRIQHAVADYIASQPQPRAAPRRHRKCRDHGCPSP